MNGFKIEIAGVALLAAALLAAGAAQAQFTISGTVTDQFAAPADSTEIRLFTGTGVPIGIPPTFTSAAGTYAIVGLPSGSYAVQFRPETADKLVAVELPVTVAGADAVRNAALQPGHLLSGFVRDGNGVGIPSIDLQVRDRDTREMILTPGDDTNASGFYDVVVPTGEYDLEWRAVAPGSPPWIPVIGREFIDADFVIDVTMFLGMLVSGVVVDSFGAPVANVNLDFVDVATGVKALTPGDNTALDGTFTAQVPVGTYDVIAKPLVASRLLAGFLPAVVIAGDTAGVDFMLAPGLLLSGTVSGPGGAVEGVDIDVADAVTGADLLIPFDVTDVNGFYQVVVPAGQFDVVFQPATATLLAPLRVPAVIVAADAVVNAVLQTGVVFSGTVTAGGVPVPGTDIDLKDPLTGIDAPLVGDGTDALGVFSTVVAPGTYILEIEPPKITGLVAQRVFGFNLAGTVNLPVSLVAGARVSGSVATSQGYPLAGVNVDALRTADGFEIFTPGDHTDAAGRYEVIVPADNYSFKFKLGAGYAVPDSVVLTGQTVAGDRTIDAVFAAAISAVDDETPAAAAPELQARPNPFNPSTTIAYTLIRSGPVRLSIHGLDGGLVAVLVDRDRAAGDHTAVWDGRDSRGRPQPSGVYLVALTAGGTLRTGKIALVK